MMTKRFVNVWRAVVGAQLTEVEADHAGALLDLERERLREQVVRYNRGLAGHAAVCERLRSRIAGLQREQHSLGVRVQRHLDADDRDSAGRCALRLQDVEDELQQLHDELSRADGTYRELEQARGEAVGRARQRMDGLRRSIHRLQVQSSLADLTEMAADMQGDLGSDDGTLSRVQERVQARSEYAAGRVRVARGALHDADSELERRQRAADAEAALRRFESARADGAACEPPDVDT